MIPMGTLHGLSRLQQLTWPDHLDVPIEEIEASSRLEVFQGRLNSIRDLNRLINSRKIGEQSFLYNIRISSRKTFKPREDLILRWKHLSFRKDSLMESSLDTDKYMLPRYIEILSFSRSGLSGCLLDDFPMSNYARDLKECWIQKEDKIECIMRLENEQHSSTGVPFQSLKTMYMSGLPNLIGLFKWEAVAPLPPGTFSCLEYLTIHGCGKIEKLFPQSLAHNFHNLQELTVENCVQMEEIIEDDNNEGADITLPKLRNLYLENLPQLKSICKGKMICDSIESINLKGIDNVKELPLNLPLLHGQLSPPPRLEKIVVDDKEWWESLEWDHHNAKNVLQPLVSFENPFETGLILPCILTS
ncbi:unnamed protein product [Fraxinus pennsylvanica]|uniref:Disease resistance protein At4g27190-like leucine-rich repeats domain-containing protein n=1 Tax=Fraxinus pennsylvanica TaxID=56036 RepID=A0AAD1ZSL0_9LAMI|nr:unnamed protein product [Fraxinus pennsylvanica]